MQKKCGKIWVLFFCNLILFSTPTAWAYCNKNEYLGITSGSPTMSTVDVSLSTFYSTTSTSGTSGCTNWDFVEYLEEVQKRFIATNHQILVEEVAQGTGVHLETLGRLMGCSASSYPLFSNMLRQYYAANTQHFNIVTQKSFFKTPLAPFEKKGELEEKTFLKHYITHKTENAARFLQQLKQWIAEHPELQHACLVTG